MRTTFDVDITDLWVDRRYFGFNYVIYRNGELIDEGNYENDHVWESNVERFKEILEEGEAATLALGRI